jgi:uncharacterized protein YkwD
MYRVVVPVLACVLLAGCSMANSSALSSGFASSDQATGALPSTRNSRSDGDGASSSAGAPKRVASAQDHIPRGTFERAPAGALADRDYSGTQLVPEQARDLINAYRKEKGLKPLKLHAALTEAAKAHSRDLAKWDRISHYGSDGSNPWDRVKRAGYNAKVAAENVGTGQASLEEVIKGWKASPGHNKNLLLGDIEHMGIALVQDSRTEFKTFWTLVVGASL